MILNITELYNKISRVLTDWEEGFGDEATLYYTLVDVWMCWREITGSTEDTGIILENRYNKLDNFLDTYDAGEDASLTEFDLYALLVDIQINWKNLINGSNDWE